MVFAFHANAFYFALQCFAQERGIVALAAEEGFIHSGFAFGIEEHEFAAGDAFVGQLVKIRRDFSHGGDKVFQFAFIP